jgi:hypothetical protein
VEFSAGRFVDRAGLVAACTGRRAGEGREEGREEGRRALLLEQGQAKFGPPDTATVAAIEAISDIERLNRLGLRLIAANSWSELFSES